uniref:Uncharacterized protein n=1 Tax=Rhizophora mucronata TaxID=61149 RepID=A0A2P2JI66_RHIMU
MECERGSILAFKTGLIK